MLRTKPFSRYAQADATADTRELWTKELVTRGNDRQAARYILDTALAQMRSAEPGSLLTSSGNLDPVVRRVTGFMLHSLHSRPEKVERLGITPVELHTVLRSMQVLSCTGEDPIHYGVTIGSITKLNDFLEPTRQGRFMLHSEKGGDDLVLWHPDQQRYRTELASELREPYRPRTTIGIDEFFRRADVAADPSQVYTTRSPERFVEHHLSLGSRRS